MITVNQAYTVMGVAQDITKNELKKQYRKLMHMVHPDSVGNNAASYRYSAYEINEAYTVLMENITRNGSGSDDSDKRTYNREYADYYDESQDYGWTAPENEYAYCSRNVYHYAESYDGKRIGRFKVAYGKYMWTMEEDFKLFLRSIYECSEELLGNIERETDRSRAADRKMLYQAELAYLLAQQYTATTETLGSILTAIDDDSTFYIDAMLELTIESAYVKSGMHLMPSGIRRHRLYVMTRQGKEAGYISFKDDRLYYVLIPILEQKRAKVKIEVSAKQDRHNTSGVRKYKNLDLWIKIEENVKFPENINMRIEELLEKFRES